MIEVVDFESYSWILFKKDDGLLLDVQCSHSAFGYSFLMALNSDESEAYQKRGREYLTELAGAIQYSAPGIRGSRSPYTSRDVTSELGEAISKAFLEWKAARE
ncbi:MAG: hypothetical protein P1U86_12895 [Verrucomicrobiales bacterium]|nr:hypothetical protein [Verrucomicrobiales bacterium]